MTRMTSPLRDARAYGPQFEHLQPSDVHERHRRDGFEARTAHPARASPPCPYLANLRVARLRQVGNATHIFDSTSRQAGQGA